MIIPLDQLSTETLTAIIEAYIFQESVGLSEDDSSHEVKVAQVKKQLEQGTAVVVYSELHESVNILPRDKFEVNAEEQ